MARKLFDNSVVSIEQPQGVEATGLLVNAAEVEHHNEVMEVQFALEAPPEKRAAAQEMLARGDVLSPEKVQSLYEPDQGDVDRLVDWLKQEGYEITKITSGNTSIYAQAPIGTITKSLNVDMTRVTSDGMTYTSAATAPSLPEDVGASVHAIIGLQPFLRAQKHYRQCSPVRDNRVNSVVANALSPNMINQPPYMVSEILAAYNADRLAVDGSGQAIGILIDTVPNESDLIQFWQQNQLNVSIFQVQPINVDGVTLRAPSGEETLDVSWSSGIAPGAIIRVYATGTLEFVKLNKALDQMIEDLRTVPEMRQISISLGLGETFLPSGIAATQSALFARLKLNGVNIFVSSGDAGSNPDRTGHNAGGPLQAEYESSDPNVVGVGGTTLILASDGQVIKEAGWTGAGGGQSILFDRPSWQEGPGVPVGPKRLIPDVSLAADPNTGAFLILHGNVQQIGGTSWSAPVWAGFCALINEARQKAGKPPLPFLNPLIYPLMGSACFRDITSGSNGAFNSGTGYDLVTGIGVPNMDELIRALT